MNPDDLKRENRKQRLMSVVAALFASTPQGMRTTNNDVDGLISQAFDIERRVMLQLEAGA